MCSRGLRKVTGRVRSLSHDGAEEREEGVVVVRPGGSVPPVPVRTKVSKVKHKFWNHAMRDMQILDAGWSVASESSFHVPYCRPALERKRSMASTSQFPITLFARITSIIITLSPHYVLSIH